MATASLTDGKNNFNSQTTSPASTTGKPPAADFVQPVGSKTTTTGFTPPAVSAKTNAPVVPPAGASNSALSYLQSIGFKGDISSVGQLSQALGLTKDAASYLTMANAGNSGDIDTKILAALKNGQGSPMGTSSNTSGTSASGSAVSSALAAAGINGGTTGSSGSGASGSSGSSSSTDTGTKTGSGTVTPGSYTDENGKFDPTGYQASALADANDQLDIAKKSAAEQYSTGKQGLDESWKQWQDQFAQNKQVALDQAKMTGDTQYATNLQTELDKEYDNQYNNYQNSLQQLNTERDTALSTAQSQYSQDKLGISSNMASMAQSQQQFNLTQGQDFLKNYQNLSTTFNFTPTAAQSSALQAAGITDSTDASSLTGQQINTLYSMAPSFFDAGLQAGKPVTDVANDFLSGTFKGQAASLAAKKQTDLQAYRDQELNLSLARLSDTQAYQASREQYYETLGAKSVIAPYVTSGPGGVVAKQTGSILGALAQITATKGKPMNAATALSALDSYASAAAGKQVTEAQVRNILAGQPYGDRLVSAYDRIKGGTSGGIISQNVANELVDVTTDIAKAKADAYDTAVYQPAIEALKNSPYAADTSMVPDYKTYINDYITGASQVPGIDGGPVDTSSSDTSSVDTSSGSLGSDATSLLSGIDFPSSP